MTVTHTPCAKSRYRLGRSGRGFQITSPERRGSIKSGKGSAPPVSSGTKYVEKSWKAWGDGYVGIPR